MGEINKDMSSLYFVLDVLCLFEARVPEFDTKPLSPTAVNCTCTVYTVHRTVTFWEI
jgi:hypothetical protein